jgi:UDP-N-acetylglucosamine 1-carboxyvinyltransferase
VLNGNNLKISNIIPEHIENLLLKLKEMKVDLIVNDDNVIVSKTQNMKSINIKNIGYPGFPTDLQQPITTLLTHVKELQF